jgi:ribosomal protein S18 acetylase RimI-like enzyme
VSESSATSLQVRLATNADLPFIVHGATKLAELEQGDVTLPLKADFPERIERYFADLSNNPAALLLIAERQGKPLGYIAGSLQEMPNDFTEVALHGLIQVLWIEPEARRLKLGQSLLQLFEATLREQGVHHIDLQYAYSNVSAAEFWNHCGYRPVSSVMRKVL